MKSSIFIELKETNDLFRETDFVEKVHTFQYFSLNTTEKTSIWRMKKPTYDRGGADEYDDQMESKVIENLLPYELKNYKIETLRIASKALKDNPLNDPWIRHNPTLAPKKSGPWPVILVLGGFTGNAPYYFNAKFNEHNSVQVIDACTTIGDAPEALYVFVDALTSWGGSQFINSSSTGLYEDYITLEVLPAIRNLYPVALEPKDWAVVGGSSGGYGALHLGSSFPQLFGWVGAIAPDSFFEASLLPELYHALPIWQKYGESAQKILEDLRNGRLMKNRNWHTLLNAFGMAACYSPKGNSINFEMPIDTHTGILKKDIWQKWLAHDPLHFLPQRLDQLQHLSGIYLDVGNKDNFHLQFGARQISNLFKQHQISHHYVEFDGNHFDIGERRVEAWKWLTANWRA